MSEKEKESHTKEELEEEDYDDIPDLESVESSEVQFHEVIQEIIHFLCIVL